MKNKLLTAVIMGAGTLLLASTSALAAAQNNNSVNSSEAFTGGTVTDHSYYAYLGALTALNGNINQDGFLLRADGGFGQYNYDTSAVRQIDGNVTDDDVMVGYQKMLRNGGRVVAFAGFDYQNHSLSPNDPLNSDKGNAYGAKGQLQFITSLFNQVNLNELVNFASDNRTYFNQTRVGYHCNDFNIDFGPEVELLGDNSYNERRFGAFVSGNIVDRVNVTLDGGYNKNSDYSYNNNYTATSIKNTDEGLFGGLNITLSF